MKRLKSQPGKGIWVCGGASLVHQLLCSGLIDRLWVSVIPVLLGDGIRLFQGDSERMRLQLVGFGACNGIVDLVYEVRRSPEADSEAIAMDAEKHGMADWAIRAIAEHPEWMQEAAAWFSEKWGIPVSAYLASMEDCIAPGERGVPQWFVVREGDDPAAPIIAGCGIIANDFHDRPDLAPNLCALYVEERFRGRGIAGGLLEHARAQAASHGFDSLYLVTELEGFYENRGWEYMFDVNETDGGAIRMYRIGASG